MTAHRNAIAPPALGDDPNEWTLDYSAVVEFGAYLAEPLQDDDAGTIRLQEYYAKPWHWTAERNYLMASRAAGKSDPDLDELDELAHGRHVEHETEAEPDMPAAEPVFSCDLDRPGHSCAACIAKGFT